METEEFYFVESFDEAGNPAGEILLQESYRWYVNSEKVDYPNFTFRVTTLKVIGVENF